MLLWPYFSICPTLETNWTLLKLYDESYFSLFNFPLPVPRLFSVQSSALRVISVIASWVWGRSSCGTRGRLCRLQKTAFFLIWLLCFKVILNFSTRKVSRGLLFNLFIKTMMDCTYIVCLSSRLGVRWRRILLSFSLSVPFALCPKFLEL
jgi:hypothetical protein